MARRERTWEGDLLGWLLWFVAIVSGFFALMHLILSAVFGHGPH